MGERKGAAGRSIPYVEGFLRRLKAGLRHVEQTDLKSFAWWVSRRDKGTLLLTKEELGWYRDVIDQLLGQFVREGDLSRRSVETMLQDAIFQTLDLANESTVAFDERLATSIAELRTRITAKPVEYVVFVPIEGFAEEDLPLLFGGVRFASFGKAHRRRLKKQVPQPRQFWDRLEDTKAWDRPCAEVRVIAGDSETARQRARRITRDALDCLNVVGSLSPYNHAWLRFPGEASYASVTTAGFASGGRGLLNLEAAGPIGHFALKQLRSERGIAAPMKTLGALFKRKGPKRATVGEVLVAAAARAGRASVEPEREQSFLLYITSLETAVLPTMDRELSYRLGVRVARLVSRNPDRRTWLRERITDLYDVRSKVAHSGSYEVTDQDLRLLRSIVTAVMLRLLRERQLFAAKKEELEIMFKSLELAR